MMDNNRQAQKKEQMRVASEMQGTADAGNDKVLEDSVRWAVTVEGMERRCLDPSSD